MPTRVASRPISAPLTTIVTSVAGTSADVVNELLDGRYRLTELLRRTEATDTWRARDCRLAREVIIELLDAPGEPAMKPVQLQATLTERYAHLADVYDAGSLPHSNGSCTFVVTTLLDNTPPLPIGRWRTPSSGAHRRLRAWRSRRLATASRR
jgi:hypothetical protein